MSKTNLKFISQNGHKLAQNWSDATFGQEHLILTFFKICSVFEDKLNGDIN